MIMDPAKRSNFIMNSIEVLKQYNLHGLDIFWQYPVCWRSVCEMGAKFQDKDNFGIFLVEASKAFRPLNFTLSAVLQPNPHKLDLGYKLPLMSKYLDWMTMLAFDYAGAWERKTGFKSPLDKALTSINAALKQGASPDKLIWGIDCTANTFALQNKQMAEIIGAAVTGNANKSKFVNHTLIYPFFEVCHYVRHEKWIKVTKKGASLTLLRPFSTSFAYNEEQWISFEDTISVREKVQMAKSRNLGGIALTEINSDDAHDICHCGKFPLLRVIADELNLSPKTTQICP
ncbi:probable chitinase 10 isoform X1 [Neocloeon triangulifer]|uniref:probable chitinase 10 isoform X1 n=1 Tax=Neocloeon triangulifer TaxID=2078957 RepID=UPI00286F7552|nr:probable chitinase 10 isoform X1 [Neocloeon triangulifer]